MPVESLVCPVAAITEGSLRWIAEFNRARRVHSSLGAVVGGGDASQWPARWFDAVECIQGEIEAAESAAMESLSGRGKER